MTNATRYQLPVDMRPYVLTALKLKEGDKCATCKEWAYTYEIDHLRYADDITIKDLQLLCRQCHKDKTTTSHDYWLTKTPHCTTCRCFQE